MIWNRPILVTGALVWALASATSAGQPLTAAGTSLDEPCRLTYFESCGSLLDPTGPGGGRNVELCSAVRPVACDDRSCDLTVVPDCDSGCADAGELSCAADSCSTVCCPAFGPGTIGSCWLSNSEFFFAGDGWKTKGDDNDNNNFGFRTGFNTGIGLGCLPFRFQVGSSIGGYDFFGREDGRERTAEAQLFLTTGFYHRSNVCCGDRISAGLVWDYMHDSTWGEEGSYVDLHQFRSQLGYAINECTEVGAWGAFRVGEDHFTSDNLGPHAVVTAMSQANLYLKRNWEFGGDTMFYVGGAEEPAGLVLGFNGRVPLSCRVAAFGGVHYAIPSTSAGDAIPNNVGNSYSEENWAVTFGLIYYPGARARFESISGPGSLPLLPVADNATFMTSAPTGTL